MTTRATTSGCAFMNPAAAPRFVSRHSIRHGGLYDGLAGPQKFALLNITARLRSVVLSEVNLLDPVYQTNIWLVFPDRIYMRAKTDLIRAVSEHPKNFNSAPAGLHRKR